MVRFGLVGFGAGGRLFHAPYIAASTECELVGIVARAPDRRAEAHREHPGAALHDSLSALIDAGVDAVTISTPPATRQALVMEALAAGVHVVADKPFAPSVADAEILAAAAKDAGLLLNVFHNRRHDTDFVTARAVLESGRVGELVRLDLRFDLDEPATLDRGPDGGLLRDLGSHLVDQALTLAGPARAVSAWIDWREFSEGRTDAGFIVNIDHESGAHSTVSATKLSRLASRELRLHGDRGSYASDFSDVQTTAIVEGRRPAHEGRERWGYESEERWGMLRTAGGAERIPSEQGDYAGYYDAFARAVRTGGPGPVPADEAIAVLAVLDAARVSADHGRSVVVQPTAGR